MDSDLDPFADILPEPAVSNARVGAKFQPKAKPRPRNQKPNGVVPTSSGVIETKEPLKNIETLNFGVPVSGGGNVCFELVNPLSQLGVTGEDLGSKNAAVPPSEAVSMGFELDPFDDVLLGTAAARSTGKFQPKFKPRLKKDAIASVSPSLPSGVEDRPDASETTQCVKPVDIGNNGLTEPVGLFSQTSEVVGAKESVRGNEGSFPDGNGHTLHLEMGAVEDNGDWHSSFQKSGVENADIFSGLEYLDDFLSQSTTATVVAAGESHPKINSNDMPASKFLTSFPFDTDGGGSCCPSGTPMLHASNAKDTPGEHDIPVLSSVDPSAFMAHDNMQDHPFPEFSMNQDSVTCGEASVSINDGGFQIDNGRLETQEAGTFPGLETLDIISESPITPAGRHPCKFLPKPKVQNEEENHMESISHPDTDCTPEILVNEETTNLGETSHSDAAIPGNVVHPEAAPQMPEKVSGKSRKGKTSAVPALSQKPQKSSTAGEGNESGELLRCLRKRVVPHDLVNEFEDGARDNGSFPAESPTNSVTDDDENSDDEYRVENTSKKKKSPRKSKKKNEKPVRKRKKANEVPDKSTKEPRKKFSHSTRRNKRQVDRDLLDTPEDEIDHQKVPIKQLILLAEFRERILNKEATTSKMPSNNPSNNQSFENSSFGDPPYDEEETFASEQGGGFDDDQASTRVQPNSSYFNYHSYMDRTPSGRWSKQDTELFFEAIRQFGTDFSIIQQLFPGRTRHQIKLKFKKEEREHPLWISEAVENRAKDHSHFKLVIERLQQVASQAEQDSNEECSIGVTGEEEDVEAVNLETNEKSGKFKQNEEVLVKEPEADVTEVRGPVKSDESDDDLIWSQYKSEY